MLRLRPVVTRQWLEEQGLYTSDQLKRQQQQLHDGHTVSAQDGNHIPDFNRGGGSDVDDRQSGTLRPCQCRITASPPHSADAHIQPPAPPAQSVTDVTNAASVDEPRAAPTLPPVRSPVATPSPSTTASIAPLSSFPTSSLASLPSSSARSYKPYKATPPTSTSTVPAQASPRATPLPSAPPSATPSPGTSDSSAASNVSVSSSPKLSSPTPRSEWSDEETVSRLPAAYSAAPWSAVLAHLLHVLSRDAISRSAFASQVHLSLSTVSRVLSGQPRVKRVEYGRMRVWLCRRDEEYVRVREGEGRGGSGVTEGEWEEWRGLAMGLEQRQRIDAMLIAADEGAAAGAAAGEVVGLVTEQDGRKEAAGAEEEPTDLSMSTDEDVVKEDSSMDVDSAGTESVTTGADEVTNVRATRNGGSRNNRGRRQSPALRPTISESQAALTPSSLASLPPSSSTSSPTSAAASSSAPLSAMPISSLLSSAPSTPSSVAAPSSASSDTASQASPATASFHVTSLPSVPPAYFTSADAILDRLDFYLLHLHLSQKTVAHFTTLPLTTVSQLIRRVYKPWPTDEQPLTPATTNGPSAVFVVVGTLLWWLDGMLSGVVRSRVGNVHDTCNLAFLSSLTVSGLSRERLNVWLDGKTSNPLHDRQWIDEIAIKEFGVTQEAVLREWDKMRGATTTGAGTTDTAGGPGSGW